MLRQLEFPALRDVGVAWHITDNPSIETLSGFPALDQAADIQVSGNVKLLELALLGSFSESAYLAIFDNHHLERLEGGPGVRLSERTYMYVSSNPMLKTVGGFSGVVHLDRLTFEDHALLAEVVGFEALTEVSTLWIVVSVRPATS